MSDSEIAMELGDNEPDTMLVCFCAYGQQDRVVGSLVDREQQSTRVYNTILHTLCY